MTQSLRHLSMDEPDRNPKFWWPEKTPADWLMEIVSMAGLLMVFAWAIYYYDKLPDSIHIRFQDSTMSGEYQEKYVFWLVPAIALIVYLVGSFSRHRRRYSRSWLFAWRIRTQHQFNRYVTAERFRKMMLIWGLFCLLVSETRISLYSGHKFSTWFFIIFGIILALPRMLVYFLPDSSNK